MFLLFDIFYEVLILFCLRSIKEDNCGFLAAGMAGEGSLHRDDH